MKNIIDLTRDGLAATDLLCVNGGNHEHYLSTQALQLRKSLQGLFGNAVGMAIYNHWCDKMTGGHYGDGLVLRQYNEHGHLAHYHGFAHSLGAAIRAIKSFSSNMSNLEKKALLLGIMYHDNSHSLGYSDDFQNIVRAIQPFTTKMVKSHINHPLIEHGFNNNYAPVHAYEFCSSLQKMDPSSVMKDDIVSAFGSLTQPNKLFQMVIEAIRYTQWPYFQDSFPNLPVCLEHVRRIDLSSSSDDDWFQQIYEGLYYEVVKPSEPGVGFIEFCENQVKFLRSVRHLYYYEDKDTLSCNKWKDVFDKMIGRAHAALNMARRVTSM